MANAAVLSILLGGSVAGISDILYATLVYGAKGVPPNRILQAIASGLAGKSAYSGGLLMAAVGLFLHFGIALAMAAVFVLAFQRIPLIAAHPLLAGAVYGVMLYIVMNYAVVPLSRAVPGTPPKGWLMAGDLAAHVLLVGLPIAFSAVLFRDGLLAG